MDRRTFLQMGAGAGILAAAGPSAAQDPKPKFQSNTSLWPLCLNTSTIRPASLKDKIRVAAEAGYDAIELWIDDLEKCDAEGGDLKAVGQEIKDRGMFVPNVIGLWNCMPDGQEAWEQSLEATRNRMRLCAAVGSKHVAAIPTPDRDPLDLKWCAARYRDLIRIGREEYNILPATEFVGFFKGAHRLGQGAAIALDADDPDAALVADTFHLYRGGSGYEGLAHLQGSFIAVFHWNDVPADPPREQLGDEHRIMPGDGILPLKRVLEILKKINYQNPLSLEVFMRDMWEKDPKEVADIGINKMREVVASVA